MNQYYIIGAIIAAYIVYKVYNGVQEQRKAHDLSFFDAFKEYIKNFSKPIPRVDKNAAQEYAPKSLGGQPLFYNESDHTYGRFVSMFRNKNDMADPRIIHNNFYRIRYLVDVTRFWWIKSSKEMITPCVFRPGIDVISKHPGEEPGVPAEGLVVIKRSMDGLKIAHGNNERLRNILMQEQGHSRMLSDMLISVQDRQRLAHMDPGSKEYVDQMTQMLQRTKKIHQAAANQRSDSDSMFGNNYGQEMYGAEDNSFGNTENDGLWRMG